MVPKSCIVALTSVVGACMEEPGDELIDGMFTAAQWEKLQQFTPLGSPPADPTNHYAENAAAAAFGQRLFFEKRFAGPLTVASDLGAVGDTDKVACATCHDPGAWFGDPRPTNSVSHGTGVTQRNSLSLVDASFNTWFGWGGAHDVEWKLAASVVESPSIFNGNRLQFAHLMYDLYKADYNAVFPVALDPALDATAVDAARFPTSGKPKASGGPDGPWELMTEDDRVIVNTILINCGKALAAYGRTLRSGDTPFDRYIAGDDDAMPADAKRGLALFIGKASCTSCHVGTTFTDQRFHVTGVSQTANPQDLGRLQDVPKVLLSPFNGAGVYSDDPEAGAAKLVGLAPTSELSGRFRTTALRNVARTAPYMHDGSLVTLDDVVRFYNIGGDITGFPGLRDAVMQPLHLTDAELADLVAFLEQLNGDPVPAALAVNTSAP